MQKLKPPFAASTDEAALYATRSRKPCSDRRVHPCPQPAAAQRARAAIYDSLQNLILFPHIGRRQTTEGVRKIVTKKYSYLIYYTVDDVAEEIVILNVKHPAREHEHEDA